MKLKPILLRAISHEFVRRKFNGIAIIVIIAAVIMLGLSAWLVSISLWWLLLAVPITLATVALAVALLLGRLLLRLSKPAMQPAQHKAVADYVDKLERVAEHVQTPVPFIVIRIVIDAVRKPETPFLHEVISDSTTLKRDFAALNKLFS